MIGLQITLADLERRRADLDGVDDAELAMVADMVLGDAPFGPAAACARAPNPSALSRCAEAS